MDERSVDNIERVLHNHGSHTSPPNASSSQWRKDKTPSSSETSSSTFEIKEEKAADFVPDYAATLLENQRASTSNSGSRIGVTTY